jgi:hypothetical protein
MADLEFACVAAEPDRYAASPTVNLRLRVSETSGTPIYAVALRVQVRIEPQRRGYDGEEAAGLTDLFGDRARWGQTLKALQLAFLTQMVPGFEGETDVVLPMPCSYDFDVAANKYLYAVREGVVPLLLLFSGTVFTGGPGGVSVLPVPWHKEATFGLPVPVWREAMDQHFPGTAWLRLGRESFDALYAYRAAHALTTWDEAVERLLKEAGP